MNVIFVEPSFPHNQREFVRALHAAGANVIGIGERPLDYLDSEVKSWLHDYVQVRSVVDEPSLLKAVQWIQGKLWVDRLEATIEVNPEDLEAVPDGQYQHLRLLGTTPDALPSHVGHRVKPILS